MSIETELEALASNLESAQSAISDMGGTVEDSGMAGLSTAIGSIPQSGGYGFPEIERTDWGRLCFWKNIKIGWTCTGSNVQITNFNTDTFASWYATSGVSWTTDTLTFSDMEYAWTDSYGASYSDSDLMAMGITLGSYEPWDSPSITLAQSYQILEDELEYVDLLSQDDYNALSTLPYPSESAKITLPTLGRTIYRSQVRRFDFGDHPTTTPDNFLSYCPSLRQVNFNYASLTTTGSNFLSGDKLEGKIVLPASMTTTGTSFMYNADLGYTSLLDFSPITVIPNGFLQGVKGLPTGLNTVLFGNITSIGNDFCRQASSGQGANLTNIWNVIKGKNPDSIGNYFMYRGTISIDSWNYQHFKVKNSIGDYFLAGSSANFSSQPLYLGFSSSGTSVKTIGNYFMADTLSNKGIYLEDFDYDNKTLTIGSHCFENCFNMSGVFNDLLANSFITSIGAYFMNNVRTQNISDSSHQILIPTSAITSPDTFCITNESSSQAYLLGHQMRVGASHISEWEALLPNKTSNPVYRKITFSA